MLLLSFLLIFCVLLLLLLLLLFFIAASKPDYSKLTLNQAKRLEMESQVRALELEKELEMERTRLAELRRIHYHLGGAGEGWDEVGTAEQMNMTHDKID